VKTLPATVLIAGRRPAGRSRRALARAVISLRHDAAFGAGIASTQAQAQVRMLTMDVGDPASVDAASRG
jgi:hypothetical protein